METKVWLAKGGVNVNTGFNKDSREFGICETFSSGDRPSVGESDEEGTF